jgi:cell division protein FtsW (lipid II flippase)
VVFLAGYLSENRALLVEQDTRIGPIRLPPIPYLVPMAAMWAIALGIVVVQRDLGRRCCSSACFLLMLYAATARISLVVGGMVAFFVGSAVLATLFEHIGTRIAIWLDPFADPLGAGYQVVQSLHAFARGGLLGMGLGNGLPHDRRRVTIPEVHTDFPLAALGEELGLIGVLGVLGIYLVIIERGCGSALRPRTTSVAARHGPRPGRRDPGLHHRSGQPQGPAAYRGDACRSSATAARRCSPTAS